MDETTCRTDNGVELKQIQDRTNEAGEQEPKTEENKQKKRKYSKAFKYNAVKTVSLVALYVVYGCLGSYTGTTRVDFVELLHTTYAKIGIVGIFAGVLALLGSILSSVLRDKFRVSSELILAVAVGLVAVADFLKPWARSIAVYGAITGIGSFCSGWMTAITTAMLLTMWGEKAAAPVHALHFGFGLGATLGPLLAKDFLSVRCPEEDETVNSSQLENVNISQFCINSTRENPIILVPSRLEIPFSITATMAMVLSFIFFIYYFLERCSDRFQPSPITTVVEENENPVEGNKEQERKQEPLKFFIPFAVGLFLLYFFIYSFEAAVYSYLFTFAFESRIGFDKQEASLLQSAYWFSYVSSRFAALWIAHFVSVKIMIFVEIIATLGSLVGLFFLGFKVKTGMWAFSCLLGVFVAPIWPSGIAWADRYVTVKAYVVTVTDLGAGVSSAVFIFLAGRFVDLGLSSSYFYVAISACAAAIPLITVMQIIGHRHGDRHLRTKLQKS